MLSVDGIDVFYERIQALHCVSLKVKEREIVALIGANGSGKTTVINTIAGVIHPTSGKITFKDIEIKKSAPAEIVRLGIALVPETKVIFPKMTVKEHLMLGTQVKKGRNKLEGNLDRIFQLFPRLKERLNQKAGTLSGGEAQMLNIGRALMADPHLLMLDEPSFGLAPKLVLDIFKALGHLREEGVTILLSEQHVFHTLELSDRAYVMETGKIVLDGSCEQLLKDALFKNRYLGGG